MRLNRVDRLDREQGNEDEAFYAVEFESSGLGVIVTSSALLVDPVHEATIIAEALQQLHAGLEAFARVVGRRQDGASVEPGGRPVDKVLGSSVDAPVTLRQAVEAERSFS